MLNIFINIDEQFIYNTIRVCEVVTSPTPEANPSLQNPHKKRLSSNIVP